MKNGTSNEYEGLATGIVCPPDGMPIEAASTGVAISGPPSNAMARSRVAGAASGISINLTPWDERRKTYTSRDIVWSSLSGFGFGGGADYAGGPDQTITAVKCAACGTLNGHTERCPRTPVEWDDHGDGLFHVNRGMCAASVLGTRWQVFLRGALAMLGTAESTEAAKVAAGKRLAALAWAEPEMVKLLDLLVLLFAAWDRSPEVARAREEAEIAKLVDDCPADLDPVGWRAAVLAYHEMVEMGDLAPWRDSIARQIREYMAAPLDEQTIAARAYLRAITRSTPPPPERRGTTWKNRGPALAVDDGRDE